LVADERDKKTEFGNLNGDGLDVHAVEAVLNEVELATVQYPRPMAFAWSSSNRYDEYKKSANAESNRGALGRTATAKASTGNCEMNAWTERFFTH
jgi:hypothetical protein